ncbi:MAG: type II secretion system F family protein [Bdellovibrionota bacterium]
MSITQFFKKNLLNRKVQSQISIKQLQECADFIDFILLNLEAGSNIEQSFLHASNNLHPGALKQGAQKILTLCQLGFSFGESLKQILQEKDCELVLRELLENLSLSLKLGSPLIQVLNHLGIHFRLIASSRLEELANEAPIKMIFPLVIFIFPVIFILLASGAIENLVRSFNF